MQSRSAACVAAVSLQFMWSLGQPRIDCVRDIGIYARIVRGYGNYAWAMYVVLETTPSMYVKTET